MDKTSICLPGYSQLDSLWYNYPKTSPGAKCITKKGVIHRLRAYPVSGILGEQVVSTPISSKG